MLDGNFVRQNWGEKDEKIQQQKRMTKRLHEVNRALKVEKNRQTMMSAATSKQAIKSVSGERRLRTRTLIQLGSLLQVSGLMDVLDIDLGDDLQLDESAQEKATSLLGFLTKMVEERDEGAPVDGDFHEQGLMP